MRLIACCLLAATSWLSPVWGGVRPRYGGTLRVAMAEQLASLDPAVGSATVARRRVTALMFDTLVWVDAENRVHPQLAVAWQADHSQKRWQFWLRPGVQFTDGTPLTAAVAAECLSGRPGWTVKATGDGLVVESETARPDLPAELALPRNALVKRGAAGELLGTGPFSVKNFVPGKSLELIVNEGSWGGRPFVDGVQIEFGKTLREQMLSLQLGKVDWIEVGAEQVGKVESEGRKAQVSLPLQLVALVGGPGKTRELEALSSAVDRKSIQSVLLRGGSEAAGGVLPEWMSGTGVLFPTQVDIERGKKVLAGAQPGTPAAARSLTLATEGGDGLDRLLAERVALNAREVGLFVQVVPATSPSDLRLKRIPLGSGDPSVALAEVGQAVGVKTSAGLTAPGEIYLAEKKLMAAAGVVPLFHLSMAWLAAERVRGVSAEKLGAWPLQEVWLETGP